MTDKVTELELELGASKLRESALMSDNEEKEARIEELEAKLSKTDPSVAAEKLPQIPTKTVEVDGKSYKFTVPSFWILGVKYLSSECVEDTEFLAEILKEGIVGILEAVEA